jgi:hypothetical protein
MAVTRHKFSSREKQCKAPLQAHLYVIVTGLVIVTHKIQGIPQSLPISYAMVYIDLH